MIEIMACRVAVWAWVSPIRKRHYTIDFELYRKRAGALYDIDRDKEIRLSHKIPMCLSCTGNTWVKSEGTRLTSCCIPTTRAVPRAGFKQTGQTARRKRHERT